jgi:hypothetical protein
MLWLLQAALLHVTTQLGGKKAELAAEASCSGPCIDSSAMLALEHSIAGKEEEVCRCLRVDMQGMVTIQQRRTYTRH